MRNLLGHAAPDGLEYHQARDWTFALLADRDETQVERKTPNSPSPGKPSTPPPAPERPVKRTDIPSHVRYSARNCATDIRQGDAIPRRRHESDREYGRGRHHPILP
ncbi:hypothetical protein GCM10027444_24850 [Actinopolyspora lacussalsi]